MKLQPVSMCAILIACMIALSLSGCDRNSSSMEQTAEQKKVTEEFKRQLEKTKQQAEKLLADAKEKADSGSQEAKESVQHAMDSADELVEELRDSGGKAWEEKKPVVDAAIKDLSSKVNDAVSKMKIGDFKFPTGKEKRPAEKSAPAATPSTTQKSKP